MLYRLAYRQSDRGIFNFLDNSDLCQVDNKKKKQKDTLHVFQTVMLDFMELKDREGSEEWVKGYRCVS